MTPTDSLGYGAGRNFTFNSGRTVSLRLLRQHLTYDGLLLGAPRREANDALIRGTVQWAQKEIRPTYKAYLVDPERRLVADGRIEWIPRVTCIAQFGCSRPVHNPEHDGSRVTVIWFQEEFALPILEPALSGILALDWDAHAADITTD